MDSEKLKLRKWLMMADFEYLSARLLLTHSVYITGLSSAARALELYLKVLVHQKKKVPFDQMFKEYGHSINKLLKELNINLDSTGDKVVKDLNESYKNRYPDNWKGDVKWRFWLHEIDKIICLVHNDVWILIDESEKIEIKKQNVLFLASTNFNFPFGHEQEFGSMELAALFKRGNNSWWNFIFN
ncbi:MAG: HEPN domain-containing protein [Candidatus Peribacteraceae bacterium]|nr:HEPN domain-containing protein [Candidatus Peribacteraceae bacterium]